MDSFDAESIPTPEELLSLLQTPQNIIDRLKQDHTRDLEHAYIFIQKTIIPALNTMTDSMNVSVTCWKMSTTMFAEIRRIMLLAGWSVKLESYQSRSDISYTLIITPAS